MNRSTFKYMTISLFILCLLLPALPLQAQTRPRFIFAFFNFIMRPNYPGRLTGLSLLMVPVSVGNRHSSSVRCMPTLPVSQQALLTRQNNAVRLLLRATDTSSLENIALAPHSLFQILAIVCNGASGDTLNLLQQYLGGSCQTSSETQTTEPASAASASEDTYLEANHMVISSMLPVLENFIGALPPDTTVHQGIDFGNPATLQQVADQINQQVSQMTHGLTISAIRKNGRRKPLSAL